MKFYLYRSLHIITLLFMLMSLSSKPTWAHSGVEVGDYILNIGFLVEPAYAGEPNALELTVTSTKQEAATPAEAEATHTESEAAPAAEEAAHTEGEAPHATEEAHAEKPVNGLESSLKAELIFGSSKQEFALQPLADREGGYTVAVIPTAEGDYTWRIFGEIEGTPVDISVTSSPDTFAPVKLKTALMFPEAEASSKELSTAIATTTQAARTALMVGGAGVLLGVLGIIIGFAGWRRRI